MTLRTFDEAVEQEDQRLLVRIAEGNGEYQMLRPPSYSNGFALPSNSSQKK